MAEGAERSTLVRRAERLLGTAVQDVSYPGGRSRKSIRLHLADRTVIATRRKNDLRGRLERGVLAELSRAGAPVPAILAADDEVLIQQDVGNRRLSEVVSALPPMQALGWLDKASASLHAIHQAADRRELGHKVAAIGLDLDWRRRLAQTPLRLAHHLGLPLPDVPVDAIAAALEPAGSGFVKWDSRPGNAVVGDDGAVVWIDWEHSGSRDRLDDLAWLVCDEYVPDLAAFEAPALGDWLARHAGDRDAADAAAYLATFGTLHMGIRLGLILANKSDGGWWDHDYCISRDKVGITREAALRTCGRAARWATRAPLLAPLAAFFTTAAERIADL